MTIQQYYTYFTNKNFLISTFFSIFILLISLVLNYYAGTYATERTSNSVTDIILSNTRAYDLDGIFIYGSIIFWAFISILCLYEPKRIPFTLKSIAFFVLIRSLFITLTHIGPFPDHIEVESDLLKRVTFAGDLFFSGHVGLPFLMTLIFWENIKLRVFFFLSSLIFAAVVLLSHLHYSIDVLAAYFITFTIYHIAQKFFREDKRIFDVGIG